MKKLSIILITVTLFVAANVNAQLLFQNFIGKASPQEYGHSVTQSADSTFLISAKYTNNYHGTAYPVISHLKKNGSLDWTKQISIRSLPSVYSTHAEAVTIANSRPDGYILLIDIWKSFYVVRLNNAGAVTWAKHFSNASYFITSGTRIKPSYDNTGTLTGFIIIANHYDEADGAIVMKIGTTGNTLWQKIIKHTTAGGLYYLEDMQATADGGCIIAANQGSGDGSVKTMPTLFKISSTGTITWAKTYRLSTNFTSSANAVTITTDGYAVTGGEFNSGSNVTFKTNNTGAILWANNYNSLAVPQTQGMSIAADAAGNLVIAGSEDNALYKPAVIAKLTTLGNVEFAKKYYTSGIFSDVKVTKSGSYCAVGTSDHTNANANIYIVNVSAGSGLITTNCQPDYFNFGKSATPLKILGFAPNIISNEVLANASVIANAITILTEENLCASRVAQNVTASKQSSNNFQVANDMAGQRVVVKWIAKDAGNTPYEVVLYNSFGQPVNSNKIFANQTAYIPMSKMQSGIYSVALKQNSQMVAQQKVVWVK